MSTIAETLTVALQHHQAGELQQARDLYCQILETDPNHADALHLLGLIAHQVGQHDLAIEFIRHALAIDSSRAVFYSNLSVAYRAAGNLAEAAVCGREAVRLQPDYAEAHTNLGVALMEQGELGEAMACYQLALRLQPDDAMAHNNLGNALKSHGKIDEALASYRQALCLQPNDAPVHSNFLVALNYDPKADPATVFAEHRRWASLHGQTTAGLLPHGNDPSPDRRLRVGYVSPDLRTHAVARFVEPILANHDPAQVESICYAEVRPPDATTQRLQALAHGWRSTCGMTDAQVADRIRADRIDILVDLAGHTAGNRLKVFALKPAPVQVTYLGYPNTTGLTMMDYCLTDAVLDPPGKSIRHTEELVRLPGCACCFAPPQEAAEVTPLPALQAGRITFGSLHNLAKLNAFVIDLWCRVLQAVPSSRLLMFRHTLTGKTREFIERQFTERGVAPDRLDLRHGSDARNYLKVYGAIDISLDVFPWTGHTTSCEALWMGVPVLTLCGTRHAGRLTATVLTALGLTKWVAETPARYVAQAVQLANDRDSLAQLRSGLRDRMRATLCDGRRFTRGLEDAYRAMWRKWCSSSEPAA